MLVLLLIWNFPWFCVTWQIFIHLLCGTWALLNKVLITVLNFSLWFLLNSRASAVIIVVVIILEHKMLVSVDEVNVK
jgi:hypothetical protein